MKRMKCAYEGCERIATDYASGRRTEYSSKVRKYCSTHAEVVSDEGSPEYTVSCPKCGCRFGVN